MNKGILIASVIGLGVLGGAWFADMPSMPRSLAGVAPIQEWKHGFKTDRVIATRYKNEAMGQFVGFEFPKNIDDADREEVSDFFESQGGWLFEGGGYPGAIAYVKFKGVNDPTAADKKLKDILPGLDKLMADMSLGISVHISLPKPKYEWPDTECPNGGPGYGGSMSTGYEQYKMISVSNHCRWVIDKEAMKDMADAEAHRRDLWQALQTRVLTAAEMREVTQYGSMLNVEPMVSFNEQEKADELRAALITQEALQREAATKGRGL